MTHASLFSGIGGFDLAAEQAGILNVFQVEIDDFCQKVLTKNFPNVEKHKDIKQFDASKYSGSVDIISGGFPCQPFSVAGQQKGTSDNRFLWREMLNCIQVIKPRYVVAENVYGIVNIENGVVFEQVHTDLEAIGYTVQTFIIPAVSVDAPHKRDRVWFVAYNNSNRCSNEEYQQIFVYNKDWNNSTQKQERGIEQYGIGGNTNPNIIGTGQIWGDEQEQYSPFRQCSRHNIKDFAYNKSNRNKGRESAFSKQHFERTWVQVASAFCRVDDGLPGRLDRCGRRRLNANRNNRIKALGNAIVPQIAYKIFKAILEYENIAE
jgi:DNA (cytosine-5)-methyltransferase 1